MLAAMRRSICLLAGLLAVAACLGIGSAGQADAYGRASVKPCSWSDQVLCGWIQVPLYRKAPSLGKPLIVRFRVYKHTDRTQPALEPIVGTEGGPGIST